MQLSDSVRRRIVVGLTLFAAAVAAVVVMRGVYLDSWLCDDVYITLRTIDNWINGYGLRWNVAERVQTYTHPLWMFLMAVPYYVTREPYYTTLFLCLFVTAVSLVLMAVLLARSGLRAPLAILVLGASQAFVQYSTSGLENPLSNVLIIGYVIALFRPESPRRLRWLSLMAALLLLNRLDYLLLVGPSLAIELWTVRSRAALREVLIGAAPLIAWELFSFFYYGSLVPNTAYAKLGYELPRRVVLEQGWRWVMFSWQHDWTTEATVGVAALCALVGRDRRNLAAVGGAWLYVIYSIWIGGDFMGGRFWVAPFVLSLCILARQRELTSVPGLVALLAVSFYMPLIPIPYGGNPRTGLAYNKGVWDEHCSYFQSLGLINVGWGRTGPIHDWGRWGQDEVKHTKVTIRSAIGNHGYYGGPELHIIDDFALGDPLLARLMALPRPDLPVGHLRRNIPYGYFQSAMGPNQILDPSLHHFYDVLRDVTRGPLWSPRRIWHATLLVAGWYRPLLKEYEEHARQVVLPLPRFELLAKEGDQLTCPRCLAFVDAAEMRSGETMSHAATCTLLLETTIEYHVEWLLDEASLGDQIVKFPGNPYLIGKAELPVPAAAQQRGFNRFVITAMKGSPPYHLGGMECHREP